MKRSNLVLWSEGQKNGVDLAARFSVQERHLSTSVELFQKWLSPGDVKELTTDFRNYSIYRRKLDKSLSDFTDDGSAYTLEKCQHISSLCDLVYTSLEKMFRRVYPHLEQVYTSRHPPTPFNLIFKPEVVMTNFEVHSYFILGMIRDADERYAIVQDTAQEVNVLYAKWLASDTKEHYREVYLMRWKYLTSTWRLLLRIVEHLFDTCAVHVASARQDRYTLKRSNDSNETVQEIEEIEDV